MAPMSMPRWLPLVAALTLVTGCVDRPDSEATGAEIYLDVCATCHAADLSGSVGPAIGPESNAAQQPDDFITAAIRDGRGRMPSFSQTLTSEQIERVVGYLRQVQGS